MSDIFTDRNISPMLIGETAAAFDSPDYIFELKLDGERCLAYVDKKSVELKNKRNVIMNTKVPELLEIYKQVKKPCILDGELLVFKDGHPDFFEIQRRSLMSNTFKIELASKEHPASFIPFDILYYDGRQITGEPLMKRKEILQSAVKDGDRMAVSRFIEERGIQYYDLVEKQDLEGIVAKLKSSKYYFGKRTKEWIKIKNLIDEDFIICGYTSNNTGLTFLLAQYEGDTLKYRSRVSLGISSEAISEVRKLSRSSPLFDEDGVTWVQPLLVCTVKYMMKTASGSLRQPVFKGLRPDKEPRECKI
ncbi:MAG: DNA ligase [Eubacteriales bacterium]